MSEILTQISNYIFSNTKDFVNICFWIFTGFLAYKTYRNAKKTLFNPVRSEMVKYQLKVITEFIDKHTSKGSDFESSINYRLLLKLNIDVDYILYLYSEEHIFDNHVFTEEDTARLRFCQDTLAGLYEARRGSDNKLYFDTTLVGGFDEMRRYLKTAVAKKKEQDNPSLKLQRLFFTKQFHGFYDDLLNLDSNPFIPQEIKKYVVLVIENITRNFRTLYTIIADATEQQEPVKYQDVLDRFYAQKIDHDDDLQQLRNQIAAFFKVNKL